MNKQVVIGICGISQSGKSSLAKSLKKTLTSKGKSVKLFEIDHYTREKDEIPTVQDRIDWEHPDSIDWNRLIKQIKKSSEDVVIVEGIFAFNSELLSLYTKTILMDLDQPTFLERRKKEIRWGEEPEWYFDHVWKTNQQLIQGVKPDLKMSSHEANLTDRALNLLKIE